MFFLGVVSVLAAIFMHQLTDVLVPGFAPEKKDLTEQFTRIMLLSPILLGISGVFGGVLVSLKRFILYSLAPIFYNAGIIFGAVFFVRIMGPSGLAWGWCLAHCFMCWCSILICVCADSGISFHFWVSGRTNR